MGRNHRARRGLTSKLSLCCKWEWTAWNDSLLIQNYIQENEAVTGMHFVTNDESWKCVEENRKTLGITDEMGNEDNKIAWKTLPLESSALKMIQN